MPEIIIFSEIQVFLDRIISARIVRIATHESIQ